MLINERIVCEKYLPELTRILLDSDVIELERSGSDHIIGLFKRLGKPGLLVPQAFGGEGCSLENMAYILRFVGSRCPSLGLAMTMHHHTVASFVFNAIPMKGVEELLRRISKGILISSAFSEARNSGDILRSSVEFTFSADGANGILNGKKKPVSMSNYSDAVLVSVYERGNPENRGLALINRTNSAVTVKDFWVGDILSSADNQCLVFENTVVAEGDYLVPVTDSDSQMKTRLLVADAEIAVSTLFQIMMCATYLGIASKICNTYINSNVCTSHQRLDILSRLESAILAVYHIASQSDHQNLTNQLCSAMLVTHNSIAQIDSVVSQASSQLGEKGYLNNEEALYIVLASKCINYHPPSQDYKQKIVDLTFATE